MILKSPLLITSLSLIATGCVKDSSNPSGPKAPALISQAQHYFKNDILQSNQITNPKNYRANQPRTILWERATVKHLTTGDIVLAPVAYPKTMFASLKSTANLAYSLSNITSLAMIPDSNNVMHAFVITFIPDTPNRNTSPSGICLVEDWFGNSVYSPVKLGRQQRSPDVNSRSSRPKETTFYQDIEVCTEIEGYNYSADDPDGGYAWFESTCTIYNFYSDDAQTGFPVRALPDLARTINTHPQTVVVSPPDHPITSITDYLKCFTNGPSTDHSYSIQVCVDQPEPGTREAWGFTPGGAAGTSAAGNAVNTGHSFLVLTENDQGRITSRNLGFYPSSMVIPTSGGAYSQGSLNNDQTHSYNISLTINVTSNQFFSVLNYMSLGNNQGYYYNLFTNNCTTFVLNALLEGGIALPATIGTWPGGSGNDPGDLGEDIRNMQLSPNMTRSTTSTAHPNVGTCN